MAGVAPLLDRLPILADSLDEAPTSEQRTLFDALQLDVVYQPAEGAIDVAATLYDLGSETTQSAVRESAEDWSRKPGPPAPATPKPPRTAGGTGSGRRGKGATGPDGASAAREARAKGRSGRAGPTGTGEGTNRHGPEQRDREGSDPTAEPPDTPPGHGEPGAHTGRRGPPTGRAHRGAAEPPRTAGGPPGTEHRRRRGGKRTRRALRAVERPLGRVLPGRHAGVRTACDR